MAMDPKIQSDMELLKEFPRELVSQLMESIVSTVAENGRFGFESEDGKSVLCEFESVTRTDAESFRAVVALTKGIAQRHIVVTVGVSG